MRGDYVQVPADDTENTKFIHFDDGSWFFLNDDGSYRYAYGPSGFRGLVHNSLAFRSALFASLGGLVFGYDQGVIANVLVMKDFVSRWPITLWQKGLMTALLELGALFGALAAGALADRLSRRMSICCACVLFCIGSMCQALANSIPFLTLGRAIGGVGIGALSMLSPLYIGEIGSPEMRGGLLTLEQLGIVAGVVIGFWFGFLTRNIPGSLSWRLPLGIQVLPGLLLGLGCFALPPSPRVLIAKGRYSEALASLNWLRSPGSGEHPLTELEFLEIQVDVTMSGQVQDGHDMTEFNKWTELFNVKYLRRTLTGIAVMFWQQWSGINALLYYGPSLIEKIGFTGETAILVGSGFVNIAQLVVVVPTILSIDKLGRRPLLIWGALVMSASHALISFLTWVSAGDWSSYPLNAWISLSCMYTFTLAYGMSFGPVSWVLSSEIFPVSVRSRGVALSTASNWINNFLIGLITPPMLEVSASDTYFVFAFACLLACLWAFYLVPETTGASLEEIDKVFSSSAGKDDANKRQKLERELGLSAAIEKLLHHGS